MIEVEKGNEQTLNSVLTSFWLDVDENNWMWMKINFFAKSAGFSASNTNTPDKLTSLSRNLKGYEMTGVTSWYGTQNTVIWTMTFLFLNAVCSVGDDIVWKTLHESRHECSLVQTKLRRSCTRQMLGLSSTLAWNWISTQDREKRDISVEICFQDFISLKHMRMSWNCRL